LYIFQKEIRKKNGEGGDGEVGGGEEDGDEAGEGIRMQMPTTTV
jgi:hypothetical protein